MEKSSRPKIKPILDIIIAIKDGEKTKLEIQTLIKMVQTSPIPSHLKGRLVSHLEDIRPKQTTSK